MSKLPKTDHSHRDRSMPKIGVVGCGDWGRNIARTLHEMGCLGGLSDPSPSSLAKDFAQTHQLVFEPFETLLNSSHIDAICIATPSSLHFELAKKALIAGKHVLVEKPLVYQIQQAKELIDLAQKQNRILMVGYLLLYHLAFQRLLQWVRDGKLGTIRHIISRRCNFGKFRMDEDVVWDLAPHDLSMILALYNAIPEQVTLHKGMATKSNLSDVATIHLKFNEDQHADITLSRCHPIKEQAIYVMGTKGMAVFDDTRPWAEKLLFDPRTPQYENGKVTLSDGHKAYEPFVQGNPLQSELAHFVECIEGKAKCHSDAQGTLDILKILCGINP